MSTQAPRPAAPLLLRQLEAVRHPGRIDRPGRPACATAVRERDRRPTSRSRPASSRWPPSPNACAAAGWAWPPRTATGRAKGAFTGEVAAQQIADAGARYVIVGHSERRQLFGETDAAVARKTKAALGCGLVPIVCIGETLAERDGGQTLQRVGSQLAGALEPLTTEETGRCVIAYEPVWAIGTGRNATPAQAVEVHRFIRARLAERLGVEHGAALSASFTAAASSRTTSPPSWPSPTSTAPWSAARR